MLQGSTFDVLEGHQMVSTVKSKIIATKNDDNEFDKVYGNILGWLNMQVWTPVMYLEYVEDKYSGTMFLLDHQQNILNQLCLFHSWTVSLDQVELKELIPL